MRINKIIALIFVFLTSNAFAYNEDYGPFPNNYKVDRIAITKLECQYYASDSEQGKAMFIFTSSKHDGTKLTVYCESNAYFVELSSGARILLKKTRFSQYLSGGMTAYIADLNQDNIPDYIIFAYGPATGHCIGAFVLSSGDKYKLTTITALFPREDNFVYINKKPCFIHTSLCGVCHCKDNNGHNFWVYNLLMFDKDEMVINNSIHPEFPKTIWYSFKPNNKETTIITDKQKEELQKDSLKNIFSPTTN